MDFAILAAAVERIGAEFVTSTLAFQMFYACRRALGVQFEMLVLLIVKIVSTGYYRVICKHVGDKPLADMCKLILRGEARHIDFHRDRLAARHPQGVSRLWAIRFHLLGNACASLLWLGHGRCLRALGGTQQELFHHIRSGLTTFLHELSLHTAESKNQTAASPLCGT